WAREHTALPAAVFQSTPEYSQRRLKLTDENRLSRILQLQDRRGVSRRQMNHKECTRQRYVVAFLLTLLLTTLALSGCKNKAAAKAEYVKRGEAFLKDKKYQEASIEFRNAIQIDDRLGSAHWGLAQAYEGLQRWGEMMDELKRAVD